MTETHDIRVSARTAQLLASDGDDEDGPPWRFSGVAVAAGDILHTDDGTRVLFTEEELRAAAETQRDEPLTADHPSDEDGRPQYPPPMEETIGKVPKAGWVDAVAGVGYEATTHDQNVADGVRAGSYDVSVHPFFDKEPYDGSEADVVAKNIKFGDLSVVSKGDSPSNTAQWGPNQALASYTQSADIGEELTAAADVSEEDGGIRSLIKRLGEEVGLLDSNDVRGGVWILDQTTDGEIVEVDDVGFDDAPWLVTLHAPGEEFPDVGEGLGPALGATEPYVAGDYDSTVDVELDEPLEEDQTLFALLRYHADGEVSDPIPTSDGGYYLDSAFVGVAPDGVMGDQEATASADGSGGNEPAESGVDADATDTMPEEPNGTNGEPDDPDGGNEEPDGGEDKTLADMTVDELGDALQEQGFVTEENADQLVEQATAQAEKGDMVDEIIAKSDDFDEEDREGLMASTDSLVEKEHKRVRGEVTAQLPGTSGAAATLTAGAGESDAVDEYGTGVKED